MISVAMIGSAKTVRLFTVGNSFADNAVTYLGDIASAGGNTLIRGNATIAGGSLSNHWTAVEAFLADPNDPLGKPYSGLSLSEQLASGTWDVVTIQQASDYSANMDSYRPYATNLYNYIKQYAPQAKILFHETWAYRSDSSTFPYSTSQADMHSRIRSNVQTIAGELGVRILPVGDVFNAVRTHPSWPIFTRDPNFDYASPTYPNVPTNESPELHVGFRWKNSTSQWLDTHHANLRGKYIGAAVFYEVLFGASVVGNSFVPSDATPVGYTPDEITTNDVVFFQGIVHAIVSASTSNQAPVAINQNVEVLADSAVNLVLTASDYDNPVLTYSIVNAPAHGILNGLNATTGTLAYTPTTGYIGADSFTFLASDGNLSATGTVSLSVAVQSGASLYFDFGSAAYPTLGNWNNVTSLVVGVEITNAIDANGIQRNITLGMSARINAAYSTGTVASNLYPATAQRDCIYSSARPFSYTIGGLNPAAQYKLTFFASKYAATRETLFIVGSSNVVLDCAYNTNWAAVFEGVQSDASGKIVFTVTTNVVNSSGYAYLSVLELQQIVAASAGDSDADGIPDSWETLYFGNATNANPASIASNGVNTIYETYIAGLNPTNAQSLFTLSSSQNLFQWQAVSGRVYSIYWTTNLLNNFQPLETNILWPQNSWTDAVHGAENEGFYRIKVQLGQ
jgi:hypothetical protein